MAVSTPAIMQIATIIAGRAAVVWMLNMIHPGLFPFDPTYPAIAVVTACEGVAYWQEKRKMAYLLIGAAIISLACFILELALM